MVEGLTVCNEIVEVVPIYCAPSEKGTASADPHPQSGAEMRYPITTT